MFDVKMSFQRLIPYLALSIRNRREALKMSHKALAELTGYSAEYLEFVESGGTNFSMKTLQMIADALDLPTSELIATAEQLAEADPNSQP